MGDAMRLTMTSGQTRIDGKHYFEKGLIITNVNTAIPASRELVIAILCFKGFEDENEIIWHNLDLNGSYRKMSPWMVIPKH